MAGRRTKRAAFLFEHMNGPAAQTQVFAAGCSVVTGLNFVGVVAQTRGCVLVLQRGGVDIRLQTVRSALAVKLHLVAEHIEILNYPEIKILLKNVVWVNTEGALNLGGAAKNAEIEVEEVLPFDLSMVYTDEEICEQLADVLCK